MNDNQSNNNSNNTNSTINNILKNDALKKIAAGVAVVLTTVVVGYGGWKIWNYFKRK